VDPVPIEPTPSTHSRPLRRCRSCNQPYAAWPGFATPLCRSCARQVRRSALRERQRVRDTMEALLTRRNANTLLTLYQTAQNSVGALARMEGAGLLPGNAAAWLARHLDDERETVLSTALRQRLGSDTHGNGQGKLKTLVGVFLQELDEVGGDLSPPDDQVPETALPETGKDLRQYPRAALNLPVHVEPGDLDATSRDVSAGGAFLCCALVPEVGRRLGLTFFAGRQRHSTFGHVRWVAPKGAGVEFTQEFAAAAFLVM